jgi:hypothetical protein
MDDMNQQQPIGLHDGEADREGAMAKADLYKLANYSLKLFKRLHDDDQLEGWVQAKITKAADYVASVYHYLEYEMKFSEYGQHLDNAETINESVREELKARLMEAKSKLKDLKKAQAEKMDGKKVQEGVLTGGEEPCTECDGTGMIYREAQPVPAHVKTKVDKYKRLTKATHAAHKRLDANNNGIPDSEEDKELDETNFDGERGTDQDTPSKFNKQKTATGTRYTRKSSTFSDEHDGGDGKKSHAKSKDADTKKAEKSNDIKLPKHSGNTWGMKGGEKFGKKEGAVAEAKKKKGDGNLANNYPPFDKVTRGDVIAGATGKDQKGGKAVKEAEQKTMSRAAKGVMKYGKDGMQALAKAGKDGKDLDKVRNKYNKYDEATEPKDLPKKGDKMGKEGNAFGKAVRDAKASGDKTMTVAGKTMPVKEAGKPSAGMSKDAKSALVKKAKSGGDIGKPGKSFDKVAKAAGGGEKGEKIAAAAMWKNAHESVELQPVAVNESADLNRLKELTQKLLG